MSQLSAPYNALTGLRSKPSMGKRCKTIKALSSCTSSVCGCINESSTPFTSFRLTGDLGYDARNWHHTGTGDLV